jgi:tetratricopeptide (TPR) repeat protein
MLLHAPAAAGPPSVAPPTPWKKPAARAQFEEGRRLHDQALYPFAVDQLQMSLAAEPRPETERLLGESFAALDQHLLAAIHFARYLDKVPADAEILNRLGCLQLRLGKLEEAAASFRRLSALDPEVGRTGLFGVELKLAERHHAAGEFRKAADRFAAALAIGGTDERAVHGLRRSLRALAETRLAREPLVALEAALDLHDQGERSGLRDLIDRAFRAAGRPAKHARRVKALLADPALK